MIVVTDAGPLLYLAGGGLLRVLCGRVVVPRIVFEEVTVAGEGLVGASEVVSAEWLEVIDRAADPALLDVLDAGEAAALPLAEELGAILLVDDGAARAANRRGREPRCAARREKAGSPGGGGAGA
jgi:predicted nucleic acid-binding protein